MKRFLSTTAVIVALTGTAYAETHASNFGSVTAQSGDFYASDLIGMRIYNSETEMDSAQPVSSDMTNEWDDIGEINDIIVSKDGEVTAVILGIGGFLGMGERDVSVSMDEIQVLTSDGDDRFLVVSTTKEELEAAPQFEREAMNDMEQTAENAEVKTEEMANDAEVKTGELANDAEVKSEEMAADAEAKTDAMADSSVDRTLLTRPSVEREGYQQAEMAEIELLTSEEIEGSYVYGANDETVGEVDRLILNADGKVEQVVINVGGFLGLGEKPVAVTFDELQILKNADGDDYRIYIDSTEEALEAQPKFEG